tara:strand:- start:62 stop:367 length:306 start_codon:yes stop_codon:yes gene_type:complete
MFRPDPEVGIDKPDVCRAFVPLRLTFFFFSSSVILSSATLSVGAISSPDGEAIGGAGVGAGGGVDTFGLPVHILFISLFKLINETNNITLSSLEVYVLHFI